MPMTKKDFEAVANAIHGEVKLLAPFKTAEDIKAFNALRGVAAVLAADFEARFPRFDGQKFVSVAMTGRSQ